MPRKKKQNGYFYEREEKAVSDYNKADTFEEKNKIYSEILHPALTKMVESIIRRYRLYIPDEEYDLTFTDCLSFLMVQIEKFNPERGHKAYSYLGTICKNHLIFKIKKFKEEEKKYTSFESNQDVYENDENLTEETDFLGENSFFDDLIINTKKKIQFMLDNKKKFGLNMDEYKIGSSLIFLLEHWDDIFSSNMGSNKFNKATVLFFLKENTLMDTKEVRKNLKIYKDVYVDMKKKMLKND